MPIYCFEIKAYACDLSSFVIELTSITNIIF